MAFGFTYTLPTISGSHTAFAVLLKKVDFPSAAIDGTGDAILNGGGNLRAYTDDTKTTQLSVDVVEFISSGSPVAAVWIRIDASTGATIYIEADDTETSQPAVTAAFGRNSVWVGWKGVWHLRETTGNDFINATGDSAFDLTSSATSTNITGPLGGGINFNSAYPFVTAAIVTAYPFSMSCWGKQDTRDATATLMAGSRNNDNSRYWNLSIGTAGGGYKPQIAVINPGTIAAAATVGIVAGEWAHVAGVLAGNTDRRAFIDGGNKGTNATSQTMPTSQGLFKLGASLASNFSANQDGDIEEPRVYDGILSDDWWATEVDNQGSTTAWGTVGAWEDTGGGLNLIPGFDTFGSFFAETVTPGSVSLTPSFDSFLANFFNEVVTPGSVLLDPAFDTFIASFFGETITTGNITLDPDFSTFNVEFFNETIIPGAVNLTPDFSIFSASFFGETISLGGGTQNLTPGIDAFITSFFNETIIPGTVILNPGVDIFNASFFSETILPGVIILSPGFDAHNLVTYDVIITPGTVTLNPGIDVTVTAYFNMELVFVQLLSPTFDAFNHNSFDLAIRRLYTDIEQAVTVTFNDVVVATAEIYTDVVVATAETFNDK